MKDNNYNNLEDQIGDIGGNPLQGKKLKNIKSSKLTPEEEQEKQKFLEKSQRAHSRVIGVDGDYVSDNTGQITQGWIPIDREELKLRGLFYPEQWQFRVRPADVKAVRSWSQIDENRPDFEYVTNQVFSEIVKLCISIQTPEGNLNGMNINSWDRFWFVMKVRNYTMSNSSKLEFTETCENCGEDVVFTVESDKLTFDFPDQDVIDKHWIQEERCWKIDPDDYDIQGPLIKLYVPTLAKDDMILQWAYTQARNGKRVDETFLRFLPWMLAKAPKDINLLDKMIKDCERIFKSWDIEMFTFMDEIVKNINITPMEQLTTTCPSCGTEVRSTVQFQHGIKSLFTMESRHKKFGSK